MFNLPLFFLSCFSSFPPLRLLSSSDWLSESCFPIGCLLSLLFSCVLFRLTSALVVVGRFASDEKRLVLLKAVVQFYFFMVCQGDFLTFIYNTDQFKPITLDLKKNIYNFSSKVICKFCIYGRNSSSIGESNTQGEFGIFRKNAVKCINLMFEPHVCHNFNRIFRFFSFLRKKFRIIIRNILENRKEGNTILI